MTATTELTAAVWNGNNFVLLSNYFSQNSDKLVLGVPSLSSYGTPTAKNNSVEASVIEKPGGLKFLSITVYYITANGTVSSNCVEFDYQIKNNM